MTHLQPHWWWNDRVICPSRATARFQRFVNWVPSRRIDVIPLPLNQQRFLPRKSREEVREEFQITDESFVIGVVGEVSHRKAPHVLLRALPALKEAGHRPRVLFAGRVASDYQMFFEQEINRLNVREEVSLLGMRRDVPDLVNASDCVCLSSTREVTPMSLLEAMSLGRPTVATRVGGIAECIRDGVDGFVVKPGRPDELADRLEKLSASAELRERMGESARQRITQTFSADVVIPQILQSYEAACGSSEIRRAA